MKQALPFRADGRPPAVLSVRNATKMLGGWRALDQVELDLYPGEICVLLGPNGAGKSTLLGAACGRIPLDVGSVSLFGQDPRTVPAVRGRLGFVPQDLAVYSYLTVRENLEVFSRMMGVGRADREARVLEALEWADLGDRADHHSDTLSGGMQRRLNIVASLLHHPDIVLLDEPTVGVDMNARDRVHELLRRLRGRGLAMLLTTHDLAQAEALADTVVVMVDGKIRLTGSPQELIRREFRDQKELKIILRSVPDESGAALLQGLDLRPARGSLTWTGPVHDDFNEVSELTRQLRGAGLETAEVRVRAPCLEGVLMRLTGEELQL